MMQENAPSSLQVRLAKNADEIRSAQELRHWVFFAGSDLAARPAGEEGRARDADRFDAACDHLLVLDVNVAGEQRVVGNYRLLRGDVARQGPGFFSASAFDLGPLMSYPGNVLELGRSCVHPAYRTRGVMHLLWRGIADYVVEHGVDLLFGRASFDGCTTRGRAEVLSYLHHYHLAPETLRLRAHHDVYIGMDQRPRQEVNVRRAVRALPPLIKGYLRLGCYVCDGAVMDTAMDQLDVGVILETRSVTDRYFRHYLERSLDKRKAA